ncbi:hypothetical protein X777_02171 [Ooceraea biroi]|uniref:Uncharacterized protein n=1 Tax=Ooceraea biroi TaxID=2015173 RepID=A0A026VSN4_OOCBI|nr:hypothetical protein X777_02171 [Ooceraea biroi]
MNKFAFQNNARQSHLPASLAARPPALSPSRPYSAGQAAPRSPCPSLRRLLHRLFLRHPIPLPPSMRRGTRSLFLAPSHPPSLSLSSGTATRATPLRATPCVLFRFSSIHPRALTLRRGVRRCHPFGPHPPVPPLCLIKRTH